MATFHYTVCYSLAPDSAHLASRKLSAQIIPHLYDWCERGRVLRFMSRWQNGIETRATKRHPRLVTKRSSGRGGGGHREIEG
jgi:hypothetical protein